MKGILLFLIASLPLYSLSAQSALPSTNIVIDHDTWDFGKVKGEKTITHTFILENKGSTPVTVDTAIEGCPCLTADIADKTILPGKKTVLKVLYETGGVAGPVIRTIQLLTNDKTSLMYTLKVAGEVID
jgi:hypothetical protein